MAHRPLFWLFAVLAGLSYGSLIPFDFDPAAFANSTAFHVSSLHLHAAPASDLIINVLIYLPLGVVVAWWRRREGASLAMRLATAILIGVGVSLTIELMQTAVASRVASWLDVLLNVFGTALGACLGGRLIGMCVRCAGSLRARFVRRPFATGSAVLTLSLFAYHLLPFDFVLGTTDLWQRFAQIHLHLRGGVSGGLGVPALPDAARMLTDGAWFAILAGVYVLASRERGWGRGEALLAGVTRGWVMVTLVAITQLFATSHTPVINEIALSALAVLGGAGCAFVAIGAPATLLGKLETAIPALLLVCLQVGCVVLPSIVSAYAAPEGVSAGRIAWLPFETLWRGPLVVGAREIVACLATYGLLAVTSSMLLLRAGVARNTALVAVLVIALAGAEILLHAAAGPTPADTTRPVLALIVVFATARWLPMPRPGTVVSRA